MKSHHELKSIFREYFPELVDHSTFVVDINDIYEIACWIKEAIEKLPSGRNVDEMENFLIGLDIELYSHIGFHLKHLEPNLKKALHQLKKQNQTEGATKK